MALRVLATVWNPLQIPTAINAVLQLSDRAKNFYKKHPRWSIAVVSLILLAIVFASGFWVAPVATTQPLTPVAPPRTADQACPKGTGICDFGTGNQFINPTVSGFDNGVITSGKQGELTNPLILQHSPAQYAQNPEMIEEFITTVERYEDQLWSSLPESEKQSKLHLRDELETEIRNSERDPANLEILVRKLERLR